MTLAVVLLGVRSVVYCDVVLLVVRSVVFGGAE